MSHKLLDSHSNEVRGLFTALGRPDDELITGAKITIEAPDKFTISVRRKIWTDEKAEIKPVEWYAENIELAKQVLQRVGLSESEHVQRIVISFGLNGLPTIDVLKLADDRLLDADWSLIAKKEIENAS